MPRAIVPAPVGKATKPGQVWVTRITWKPRQPRTTFSSGRKRLIFLNKNRTANREGRSRVLPSSNPLMEADVRSFLAQKMGWNEVLPPSLDMLLNPRETDAWMEPTQ